MNFSKQKKGLIILAMALGLLMSALDNTIVSASITHILDDFGGFNQMSWVFTAYMLASTSTMLVLGKMSDLFGRKLFYLIGIGLFILGSALCGVAQSLDQLIWFRAIQGIGSGAIFPISFTIIFSIFSDPKDGAKLGGVMAAIFGLSSVAGPQVGTFITEHFGWRWCFYVNLPIGILSFIVLLFALQESRSDKKPKIDYMGTILLVFSCISVMLAMEWGGKDYAWTSWQIIGLFLLGILGTIAFIQVERRASEPVLPLEIFKNRLVLGTSIICFCQGVMMFSAISYLPIFSVAVLGHANSNGILTPMMTSMIVGTILCGFLQTKLKFRTIMTISMLFGVATSIMLILVSHHIENIYMIGLMILLGFGAIGPMMSVGQNAMLVSVDKRYMGISSSIVGFWRNIGGVMGASIMAVIVNNNLKGIIADGAAANHIPADKVDQLAKPDLLVHASSQVPAQILGFLRDSMGTAINHGFILSLCVAVIGVITALSVGSAKFQPKPQNSNAEPAQATHMA
jgi:EmrB/QacA subfamily drug resistance transporter